MANKPEIFFHVGLGKAASTYLQYRFFPKLKGICYIKPTRYRKAKEIITRSSKDKFLVSREFDLQLEREVEDFSADYPDTKAIIVLRRHDSWIASQYRRFVKNGFGLKFQEFFDIDDDRGLWKQKDLYFFPKIQVLERYFTQKPLVLFFEDLRDDPFGFFDRIAKFTGTRYDRGRISLSPKHKSYNDRQLKVIFWLSKQIDIRKRWDYKINFFNYLHHFYVSSIRYPMLYLASLVPDSLIGKEELIPTDKLSKIQRVYEEDWNRCLEYARGNDPLRSKAQS